MCITDTLLREGLKAPAKFAGRLQPSKIQSYRHLLSASYCIINNDKLG